MLIQFVKWLMWGGASAVPIIGIYLIFRLGKVELTFRQVMIATSLVLIYGSIWVGLTGHYLYEVSEPRLAAYIVMGAGWTGGVAGCVLFFAAASAAIDS